MTWIEEYRRKIGMTRQAFAHAVTSKLGGTGERRLTVPANLIYILEVQPHPVTHPRLMNLIARACGATKQQRDQFLNPSRRGFPYAEGVAAVTLRDLPRWERPAHTATTAAEAPRKYQAQSRAVVIVNQMGTEIARHGSVREAAEAMGKSESAVSKRITKQLKVEFTATERLTCRYADEWDTMTIQQRQQEMREAAERSGIGVSRHLGVVVIDAEGNERARYDTAEEAASAEFMTKQSVCDRCKRRIQNDFFGGAEVTFRYSEQWDKMTRAQQLRDIGAAM